MLLVNLLVGLLQVLVPSFSLLKLPCQVLFLLHHFSLRLLPHPHLPRELFFLTLSLLNDLVIACLHVLDELCDILLFIIVILDFLLKELDLLFLLQHGLKDLPKLLVLLIQFLFGLNLRGRLLVEEVL